MTTGGEEVSYFVTQLLLGDRYLYLHRYLHKIGTAEEPDCVYCPNLTETAEKTILHVQVSYSTQRASVLDIAVFEWTQSR